jgi:hypothetical protein
MEFKIRKAEPEDSYETGEYYFEINIAGCTFIYNVERCKWPDKFIDNLNTYEYDQSEPPNHIMTCQDQICMIIETEGYDKIKFIIADYFFGYNKRRCISDDCYISKFVLPREICITALEEYANL